MSLQNQVLKRLESDPKIEILNTFQGLDAVRNAEMLFFKADHSATEEWSKQWTASEKRDALLIVFQWKDKTLQSGARLLRTCKHFGFNLVIGESVLGEKYREMAKDKLFFEMYHYL